MIYFVSLNSTTPCIIGQKIVTRYFRGPNYLEMTLHVGSSAVADKIVGLCRSYCSTYAVNIGMKYNVH
jgi:hypothetical protein